MARTIVALPKDTWVNLGTGPRTVTVEGLPSAGPGGTLYLNTAQSTAHALSFPAKFTRHNTQVIQDVEADTTYAYATELGWRIGNDG